MTPSGGGASSEHGREVLGVGGGLWCDIRLLFWAELFSSMSEAVLSGGADLDQPDGAPGRTIPVG